MSALNDFKKNKNHTLDSHSHIFMQLGIDVTLPYY